MSQQEADRRLVQEQMQELGRDLQHVQPHEVGNWDRAQNINNEIDRIKKEQENKG